MKPFLFYFLFILCFSFVASAQFNDDFSDGDFTSNPEWTGDTSKFRVSAGQLQLYDSTESGTAYLSTPSQSINNASWEFLVNFDGFNPSSSNFANIYLISDQADLLNDLNGYFVKIGNTEDEVSLYRQDGSVKTEIIDGTDDRLDMTGVLVSVKVTRDSAGNWELFSDTLGGTNYYQEGSVTDSTHPMSFYSGVYCEFTSTRWDKMFFDDFVVTGDPYQDTVPPEIQNVSTLSDNQLLLEFSEPMDDSITLDTSNYSVNNGIGRPSIAYFDSGDPTRLILEFSSTFVNYTQYSLSYQNCEDLFGNSINSGTISFSYLIVEEGIVVINEIMADPSPVVGLPEVEYLEIYNTLDLPVDLSGWQLEIGSSTYEFPVVEIPANDYFIICKQVDSALMAPYGEVIVPDGLSGYILPNSGSSVKIIDNEGLVVDEVSYTDEWYQDPNKDDGGWSIEKIDPLNNCSGIYNWAASTDSSGGTPGAINSIYDDNQDTLSPEIVSSSLISPEEIVLEFSERCDTSTLLNTSSYTITPNLGEPDNVVAESSEYKTVHLKYTSSQMENLQYELTVSNIEDVCGNVMEDTGMYFQDTVNPKLLDAYPLSANQLFLQFSEPMDPSTSLDTANYSVNQGLGEPSNVIFNPADSSSSSVILQFMAGFQQNTMYSLAFQDCEDRFGNAIDAGNKEFAYVVIEENDIVINEIMANPSPSIGLPEVEYLEIYNIHDLPVNLSGWQIDIDGSTYDFPVVEIPADDYLIICKQSDSAMMSSYGVVAAPDGLSGYILPNSGSTVKIIDNDGLVVDEVSYTDEWYQDPNKDDGGWSIEKIDPLNNCSGMYNWTASTDPSGGTPGALNSVDAPNQDTIAPSITTWKLAAANEINIEFSEIADTSTSLSKSNYNISPGLGQPLVVSTHEENSRIVRLLYGSSFNENVEYTLSISNIADRCGNIMNDTSLTFINYPAEVFDVLITEIMPDPSPVVYLPEAEYIELFNQSDYTINTSGWTLMQGSTDCELPAAEILPGEYVALTNEDNISLFPDSLNVVGVNSLPSLPNTSGELKIFSKEDKLIHFVNYTSEWYGSSSKEEGGWSLEMIDTGNPCGENNNWKASTSSTGGTPAKENSVQGENPDIYIPELSNAIITEPDTLIIYFSEYLHPGFEANTNKFTVNNGIGNPFEVNTFAKNQKALKMVFTSSFEEDMIYTLTVSDSVKDCAGNMISESVSIDFAIPDTPEKFDIVINEILFNPRNGGSDFVELYNNSEKIIDLRSLRMASRDDEMLIDKVEVITEEGFLLFPGDFVVVSENIINVEDEYYCKNPDKLIQVEDLPSYPNTEGDVVLCKPNQEIIDEVVYNEDMHFSLLRSVEGVSLERIDYNKGSDKDNWHSAAEDVGFGTPTYQNSQYMKAESAKSQFDLFPESFSPDNDGYHDVLNIAYKMDKPGYVLSIRIFDASGHPVKNLVQNELLGAEGSFTWNGLDNNDQHPGSGIYILLFEYYDLEGNLHKKKHTTVIAKKK